MNDEHPLIIGIVRYGLPLVVALFYLTASLAFDYTPDSVYPTLRAARELIGNEGAPIHSATSPNPLWVFFVALGGALRVDTLLTAKVFSLFFASLSVLLGYLVASEILRDRLLAFCAALVVAMQSLLLQIAPSGTAYALAMALSLAAVFFLLRNEYLLATVFTGLCSLLFWEGSVLFVILAVDVWLNSTQKPRAWKVIGSTVLVYLSLLLPWVLYSVMAGVSVIPRLQSFGDFPGFGWREVVALSVTGVLVLAGVLPQMRGSERIAFLRNHFASLAWGIAAACISVFGSDLWVLSIPLAVMFGFHGVKQLLMSNNMPGRVYPGALLLSALLLALSQASFVGSAREIMAQEIEESVQMIPIAYWIKAHVPVDATIHTVRRAGILSYYAGRDIVWDRREGDYSVDSVQTKEGYEVMYIPEIAGTVSTYGVWRRQ